LAFAPPPARQAPTEEIHVLLKTLIVATDPLAPFLFLATYTVPVEVQFLLLLSATVTATPVKHQNSYAPLIGLIVGVPFGAVKRYPSRGKTFMFVNRRILIVDDNVDIHSDFQKILGASEKRGRSQLTSIEMELFADDEDDDPVVEDVPEGAQQHYELDFAYQGEEAVKMVSNAYKEGRPYALVFMDVRMPPGIDGIETISRIWKNHPNVEMVICTAYSDYSFDGVLEKLGSTDRLLFLTNFYPTQNIRGARGSAVRSVSLEANHYCIDWLYFGALPPGNYKLQFESGGETLTMPVFL
jgi:CheY-like chemotaxis protein